MAPFTDLDLADSLLRVTEDGDLYVIENYVQAHSLTFPLFGGSLGELAQGEMLSKFLTGPGNVPPPPGAPFGHEVAAVGRVEQRFLSVSEESRSPGFNSGCAGTMLVIYSTLKIRNSNTTVPTTRKRVPIAFDWAKYLSLSICFSEGVK
jgi:hypothetical protein